MNEIILSPLDEIIKESGLDERKASIIRERFADAQEIAREWNARAKTLIVTNASQTAEMKMAREARLALREKRIEIEKTRKELKEDSIKEGRAVDTVAKKLTDLIEPIEMYLKEQEDFVKIQEEKKQAEQRATRLAELQSLGYMPQFDVGVLPDDAYNALLGEAKRQDDARKQAELDRIAREKEEEEKREKMRAENERLRAETEKQQKALAEQQAKQKALELQRQKEAEEARKALEAEKLRAEQEKQKALAEQKRIADEKLRIEREEHEKEQALIKKNAITITKDKKTYTVTFNNGKFAVTGIGDNVQEAISQFCRSWIANTTAK